MSKVSFKEAVQTLLNLFEQAQLPEDLKLKKISEYLLQQGKYQEKRTLQPSRQLKGHELTQKEKFQQLYDALEKSQELKEALQGFELIIGYDKGDKFIPVEGLEKLTFQEDGNVESQDSQYSHEEGFVTLIDFWATWCGPCQGPMNHNEQMLKKNEELWKDRVKIVGLSFDDERDPVVTRVNQKDWKRVQHYRFKNGWDNQNQALNLFGIDGIPFVALLNKFGRIVFMGHPSGIELESEINKLIEKTEDNFQEQSKQEQAEVLQNHENFKNALKFLRNQWKDFVEKNKLEELDLNLKLKKEYQLRQGQKTNRTYNQLVVDYKITKDYEQVLNDGLKLINEYIPSDFIKFERQVVNDPQQNFINHSQFLTQTFQKYGLNNNFELNTEVQYNYKNQKLVSSEKLTIQQDKPADIKFLNHKEDIKKDFKEYIQKNQEKDLDQFLQILRRGPDFKLSVGDKFVEINDIHKLGDQNLVSLNHEEGQVLVVDFWAFWCGPCVAGMMKSTEVLKKKKEEWGNKVKFVAISLEGENDSKNVLEKYPDWQENIEFYFLKNRESSTPDIYGVQYIPHYVVVGKDGIIRALGSQKQLDQTVEELLKEEGGFQQQVNQVYNNKESFEQLINFFKDENNFKEFLENANNLDQRLVKFNLVFNYTNTLPNKEFKQAGKPKLTIWIRENNKNILDEILNKLFAILPKENFEINETISKTVNIPFPGSQCDLCKKQLNDQTPQYYSKWNDKFYCTECAEWSDPEAEGNKKYKITDTLVYINAPLKNPELLKNIDEYKFGKNIQLKEGEKGSQTSNHYQCNGCRQGTEGPRYIGIASRPGPLAGDGYDDFCPKCFANMKNPDSDEAKSILENNPNYTFDQPLLRVLFNHGYWEF